MQAQVRVKIKSINACTKKEHFPFFSLDFAPIRMSHVCTSLYGRPNVSILAKLYSLSLNCSSAVANTYSLSIAKLYICCR